MNTIPSNFKQIYSREQIEEIVRGMGASITEWTQKVWQDSHTDVLSIPVLGGGLFFFADLVRQIKSSVELAPVKAWAYEPGEHAVQRSEVKFNMDDVPVQGRCVLLVDDICDSGRTLKVLTEEFLKRGAREVRSAVFIKRELEDKTFSPTWVGTNFRGPEWFVGYGMDDCQRWRNLPDIHIIRQS